MYGCLPYPIFCMYICASSASCLSSSLSSGAGLSAMCRTVSPCSCLLAGNFQMRVMQGACPRLVAPGGLKSSGCRRVFSRSSLHFLMVVIQCPVEAGSMTYFCNHFFWYSSVSAIVFLVSSISSSAFSPVCKVATSHVFPRNWS